MNFEGSGNARVVGIADEIEQNEIMVRKMVLIILFKKGPNKEFALSF